MKRHVSLVLLSLLLALLVAACGGAGKASLGSSDVAVVGNQTITKDDFSTLLERAKNSFATQKRPFPKPGTRDYETLKGQAIAFLVQRAEFAEKADDMGIHSTDKQVDDRIEQLKKQYYGGSEKKYEDTIKQQGLTPDQARNEVKAQLISEALFKKVTGDVKVTDKAIQDYYNANKSVYVQKESRDIRHILVPSKSLADKIYAQLVAANEKNFATLAKRYSKDPGSAANGGKLTITRGQTVPPFDQTAFALKKGQLSQPVKTQYGWHIIQALSDIRPPSTTPLSKVKESIRQQLEQQKKNGEMTKWVDDMKRGFCQDSKIKYQVGYQPNPDPCASITTSTTETTTTTP